MQASRKLAAIFSSDVFGYSRLMGDDEQATLEAIVETRRLMAAHVERHDGRVVDATGDALLAEFASAVEAVRCAREIQRELALKNAHLPEHRRMLVRIGLNLGDVLERDGALYGDGVNIAARLQTAGEPGGVCISGSVLEQVEGKLPLRFEPVGEHHFKNIARAVRAYHVRDAVRDAVRDGADGSVPVPAEPLVAPPERPAPRHNLPRQLSSFVGRASDIAAVKQMLLRHRLVTLLGPGGIGKTRLSLQVAAELAGDYPDGVWLVELAALADARLVTQAVASVLGIKEEAGRPVIEAVLKSLADKQLLLILDNCEHLLQACAELAQQLLRSGADLKVLATSREHLHLTGEASFLVPALAAPDPQGAASAGELQQLDAVRLFVDRATAAQPAFQVTDKNAAAVAAICYQLDGIPLALELAAACVRTLPVAHIATHLGDRFNLFKGGDRTARPGQQTLLAAMDWSHALLTLQERALLRRLAVFAGGWTLDAAEAVGAGGDLQRGQVVELLGRLVEKSLVTMKPDSGRYLLLQTVRQYAQDRLNESDDADVARSRHLLFYLELAERASALLAGPEQGTWLERLDPEQENILSAHSWCDRADNGAESGLRLMFALKLYLFNRGLLEALRRGTLEALARPGAEVRNIFRCRALHTAGQVGFFMGRFAEAQSQLEEALSIANEVGDTGRAASVLQALGMTCVEQGDRVEAHRYMEQALALAQQRGDQRELAAALNALAQLHRIEGTLDSAEPLYQQGLALARQIGDRGTTAVALLNLAMVAIGRESPGRAGGMLLEALDIAESVGSRPTGGNVLAVCTGLAALRSDWAQAAWFLGAAQAQMQHTGIRLDAADEAFLAPLVAQARQALATDPFAAAEQAARMLTYEQAIGAARKWLIQQEAG